MPRPVLSVPEHLHLKEQDDRGYVVLYSMRLSHILKSFQIGLEFCFKLLYLSPKAVNRCLPRAGTSQDAAHFWKLVEARLITSRVTSQLWV